MFQKLFGKKKSLDDTIVPDNAVPLKSGDDIQNISGKHVYGDPATAGGGGYGAGYGAAGSPGYGAVGGPNAAPKMPSAKIQGRCVGGLDKEKFTDAAIQQLIEFQEKGVEESKTGYKEAIKRFVFSKTFWGIFLIPAIQYNAIIIWWCATAYASGYLTCLALSLLCLFLNVTGMLTAERGSGRMHIGILACIGAFFGTVEGIIFAETYFVPYQASFDQAKYTDNDAFDAASGRQDAGGIVFKDGVAPDLTQVVGFKSAGNVYCVAPVVKTEDAVQKIQYWAVGMNCCSGRGDFTCSDARDDKARSGRVVRNRKSDAFLPLPDHFKFYKKAIAVSTSVYPLETADNALLVEWVIDLSYSSLRNTGVFYICLSTFLFFLFVSPLACLFQLSRATTGGRRASKT